MVRTDALQRARQIVAGQISINQIDLEGEQRNQAMQRQEQQAQGLAASLLRQASAQVVTISAGKTSQIDRSNNDKSGSSTQDRLEALSTIEKENSSEDTEKNQRIALSAYYILAGGLKSLAQKFNKLITSGSRDKIENSEGYKEELKNTVQEISSSKQS